MFAIENYQTHSIDSRMNVQEILSEIGPKIREEGIVCDLENKFAAANFNLLKAQGLYKALIPVALGGHGVSYSDICYFIKDLAKYCPSTALTLSMHMHLVAVMVFRYMNGDENAGKTLQTVAEKDLVLLSTGGGDWVSSNGSSVKVEGGYRVTCTKSFCSGAPIANVAAMSCAFNDGDKDLVIHFSTPLTADGIEIGNDWNAMGMRATGSHSIHFRDVFIPDEKITLTREKGKWHPIWDVISTLAFPIFISPYAGIVDAIAEKTIELFNKKPSHESYMLSSLGEMHNYYQITKMAHQRLVDNAKDLNVKPNNQTAANALQSKSLITEFGRKSAQAAMESLGGQSYFYKTGIERYYRDLMAGEFHPMQSSKQKEMLSNFLTGKSLAG